MLKPEAKLVPTACSTNQIAPDHRRKRHGVQHFDRKARLNVQERGLDGAVVRPSGFHKRGYENVSQAASTMFWEGFPKDRGREEVTLLFI